MLFNYAVRNKLMRENIRTDAVIPKKAVTVEELEENSIEETFFESHELDMFLDAVLKIGLELDKEWFFLLAFSSMRSGELCSLQKNDLDFENNTIRISKSLYTETNNSRDYELSTTKTSTIRIIDMDESIMKMLKRLVRENDKHKMKYRTQIEDFHDSNFVFQRPNGYPYITKNIATRMSRVMKYLDIKKHLTPHSLRHSHISMMTEAKNDLPTIMQQVGHEDPNTTLRIYTHVMEKMKSQSIKNVTSLHDNILEKLSF